MIRRYLLPLLFLLLSSLTQAQTGSIPATNTPVVQYRPSGLNSAWFSSPNEACSFAMSPSYAPAGTTGFTYNQEYKTCYFTPNGGSRGVDSQTVNSLTCPSGYVLNGTMCDPQSACEQVKGLINGTPQATRWYMVPVGSSNATGDFCDSGCAAKLAIAGTGYYTDGKMNSVQRTIMYTGQSCTNEPNAPQQFTPEKAPVTPEKKPPCAASEGVMTSSSGTIACVPEGTPNSNPPIVKKESTTKTNADGSKEITETTTTRDPLTGVEQKYSTTTTKDANDNTTSVSSSSGTSGTTNGGNPEKPGDSDFCQKNPSLDICTGKLNKEETQKKVADSLSAENFDAATHLPTSLDVSTEARQKADQGKDLVLADIQKFGTAADPSSGKYAEFQDQMKGWLGEIPVSGCTPFSAKIGPYNWNFDHCEKAAKIAEIFGYCLWVMLAFGVFSLATRNRG